VTAPSVAVTIGFDATAIRELSPPSLFSLEGRVALVTGAGGGIGRWLAAGLGAAGAAVVVTDIAEPELEDVRGTLTETGIDARAVVADLGTDDAPDQLVGAALEFYGRLDIVVNNAVVNRRMPILDMDPETWDLIMRIDLRLPYFLSRRAAREMIAQGGGSIVNIGSLNAAYALENVSVYGLAKAGISQLTRVMAVEWAQHGIRANAIAPGFMDTPLAAPIWADEQVSRWIMNRVPMRRRGLPSELVGICQLLASDAASFLSGQTIYVDGGALAGGRWFTPDA
jgi:NAD(P)-dependent dehydrogenase (short-subunit alcohol dehydrogenase family)